MPEAFSDGHIELHRSAAAQRRPSAADVAGHPKCSVVIPVYGKASLTRQCLDAILSDPFSERVEIIVVDDASPDDTPKLLREYGDRIRIVRHQTNAGFATACNAGAAIARADYLVFLNNDTIPTPGWLTALEHYADEHPRVAVVGAKLLFPNDTIQHAGVVISADRYPRHIYLGFDANHPVVNTSRAFQVVTAACSLIRRDVFIALGGFDTAFRNGYEDVDFCFRAATRGHEVHYCHDSVVYHLESMSREGNVNDGEHNTRLLFERWGDSVRADELDYYLRDGLLRLSYTNIYPIHLVVSPELALVFRGNDELPEAERLLNARSRQVHELLRDNIRLTLRAREAERHVIETNGRGLTRESPSTVPTGTPRLIHRGEIRWMSNEPSGKLVSIVIPVKNGGTRLRELLPRILEQRTDYQIEIIAVDSGSHDDTVDVLREHACTVVGIDSVSFNHGLTRNLGATYTRGDVLVFTNQSALPADDSWLANLLEPLDTDPEVAGVCSKVLPRENCDPLVYLDGVRDPSASDERSIRVISDRAAYETLSHHELRLLINFHTVSAAIRPEVLTRIPFRAVTIGEDLAWAKDVLEAGLKIQHEPSSVVLHSHAYSLLEIFQRNVDDGLANREIVARTLTEAEIAPLMTYLAGAAWRYLEDEVGLSGEELDNWRIDACARRTAQVLGQWIGVNRPEAARAVSLTERIKTGGDSSSTREGMT